MHDLAHELDVHAMQLHGGIAPAAGVDKYIDVEHIGSLAARQGATFAAPRPPMPRLSVLLQYFKMPNNIAKLAHWRACPGIELLVHVDSRMPLDLAWLNTSADHLLYDPNVHEIRGYNLLARMARAPLLAVVQDDMPAPTSCAYLDMLEQMLRDDPALAAIGWRTWSMTPMFFAWDDAWGARSQAMGPMKFQRRVSSKLNWWQGSPIRAQYAALVDVGPLFLRTRAFMEVGSFNEGFSEPGKQGSYHDWEFSTRLWLSGWRVAFQETSNVGLMCICFECSLQQPCKGWDWDERVQPGKGCNKESKKAGRVRNQANYSDFTDSMLIQRKDIMHFYKPHYANISHAVARLNTLLAASNGFVPHRGALVKWDPGKEANQTLLQVSTRSTYCKRTGQRCCSPWGT